MYKQSLPEFLSQNPFSYPLTQGFFYREKMRAIYRVAPDLPFENILEVGGGQGMPWYGRAHITALEPQSQTPSHGLEAAIAAGTARRLPPHGRATARLVFTVFTATDRPVAGIDRDGHVSFQP